jgi:hypothetical protein
MASMFRLRRRFALAMCVGLAASEGARGDEVDPCATIEGCASAVADCGAAVAPPAAFTLDQWLGLAESEFYIQGHVQQGANLNSRNPGNPPGGFGNAPAAGAVYSANDYQLNQIYVSVGNATDTSTKSFDVGYQCDLAFGTDYVFLQSHGLEKHSDGSNRWNGGEGDGFGGVAEYGLAMPQLCATFAYEQSRVVVGHFYNILGHEALIPTENFYYTWSYPLFFNGYGESVPVTGAFAQTQLGEQLLVGGGFHRGQGRWEDNNDSLNGISMVEWSNVSKSMFVTYTSDIGHEDDAGENLVYAQSVVFELQFNPKWSYALNSWYGFEENVAPDGGTATWYGFGNYFAHNLTERVILGARYDFFDDVDGTRVFPRAGQPAPAPGIYNAITLGANYIMNPNMTLRPEVRWDWFSPDGAIGPGPFDNLTARDQFMAAVDFLVTF